MLGSPWQIILCTHRPITFFSISSILDNMFTCVSQTQVVMNFIARFFFLYGEFSFHHKRVNSKDILVCLKKEEHEWLKSWGQDTGMGKWRQVMSTTPFHSFLGFVHSCYKCNLVYWPSVILPLLSLSLTLFTQVLNFLS